MRGRDHADAIIRKGAHRHEKQTISFANHACQTGTETVCYPTSIAFDFDKSVICVLPATADNRESCGTQYVHATVVTVSAFR